ncbi:MAG TPA: fumarylacetoacetate hydrolase family protein [Alphaproteobacteria bacterium]|nr:fumarylacetoacetate hydrolase family protein [Alphaproteobacteria bacterium]
MKLMSYEYQGKASYGAVKDGGVVDLGRRIPGCATLKALLAAGGLAEAAKIAAREAPDARLDQVKYLPLIPDPNKILAIGLNYSDHAAETGMKPPAKPIIFPRWPDSQVGHEEALVKPAESDQFDYEVELCIVIGKPARRVSVEKALDYVAGYTVYNDGSIRDWQFHTSQWAPGKNFPRSGSVGPWLVTSDEVGDTSNLKIMARLNGQTMQNGSTSKLIFTPREIVSYASSCMNLSPGDLIPTGTPPGVGFVRKPPVFMKAGDVIECEIERIGTLRNKVIAG